MALLEAVMTVEVETPEQFQGSVTGHLLRKRGLVTSSETREGTCVIVAEIPLAEKFDYANEIRSMTQGQGRCSFLLKASDGGQLQRAQERSDSSGALLADLEIVSIDARCAFVFDELSERS